MNSFQRGNGPAQKIRHFFGIHSLLRQKMRGGRNGTHEYEPKLGKPGAIAAHCPQLCLEHNTTPRNPQGHKAHVHPRAFVTHESRRVRKSWHCPAQLNGKFLGRIRHAQISQST